MYRPFEDLKLQASNIYNFNINLTINLGTYITHFNNI